MAIRKIYKFASMEKQFIPRLKESEDNLKLKMTDFDPNPFSQFKVWYAEALEQEKSIEPNAMVIATSNQEGRPSSRYVLMKYYDSTKFVFFTNYNSRKGQELSANPNIAALFYWPTLSRQIRIEGPVKKCDHAFNNEYFRTRDVQSRLAGLYSKQSSELTEQEKEEYKKRVIEDSEKLGDEVHAPENWGGFEIHPDYFEFWVGQKSRMHDRFVYEKQGDEWRMKLLYP